MCDSLTHGRVFRLKHTLVHRHSARLTYQRCPTPYIPLHYPPLPFPSLPQSLSFNLFPSFVSIPSLPPNCRSTGPSFSLRTQLDMNTHDEDKQIMNDFSASIQHLAVVFTQGHCDLKHHCKLSHGRYVLRKVSTR